MRKGEIIRETRETKIRLKIELDGDGQSCVSTGIGFFDHMLTTLAKHSGCNLSVEAEGDLRVDGHHTVEDVGICLGKALAEALGDRSGLCRYGHAVIPMDDALAVCALDAGCRSYLVFQAQFDNAVIGSYETGLSKEFFQAVCANAQITIHLHAPYGENDHHKTEALFKAFAHALAAAVTTMDAGTLSTKGVLS